MATIRTMSNQILVGRVGQTTYYSRQGQQVARQARNNSNYGESASRTYGQMSRRVKWSNLVNLYKSMQYWMPKAFEGASKGVTVYNKFMSLNVPITAVNLAKDVAQAGGCVLEPIYVSRGQLPSINLLADRQLVGTDIDLYDQIIGASTTVAEVSAAIIQRNPDYIEGDNIALIHFYQDTDELGVPHVQTKYYELTLDTSSTVVFGDLAIFYDGGLTKDANYMAINRQDLPSHAVGTVFIHTRKVGGSLRVSSQRVFVYSAASYSDYTTPQSEQMAIDSYGLDPSVPLDPGSGGGGGGAPSNIAPVEISPSWPVAVAADQTFNLSQTGSSTVPVSWNEGEKCGRVVIEGEEFDLIRQPGSTGGVYTLIIASELDFQLRVTYEYGTGSGIAQWSQTDSFARILSVFELFLTSVPA